MKYSTNVQSDTEPQIIEHAMTHVYVRTNISSKTVDDTIIWTYDEASFTNEEYACIRAQAVFAEIACIISKDV